MLFICCTVLPYPFTPTAGSLVGSFFVVFFNSTCLLELLFHGRVAVCQFLYCQSVCLVVGKAQVAFRAHKGFLYLLQVGYRLVYLVDCGFELLARKSVVVGKLLLEVVQAVFKVGYVD